MNSKKKSILFIIPSLVGGGAERVLIYLLNSFNYNNYDVTLCVVQKKGFYLDKIPSNVKVIILFKNEYLRRVLVKFHIWFQFNIILRIWIKTKIKGKFDLGISFLDSSYTDILIALGKKINKRIAWVHGSYLSNANYSRVLKGNYLKWVRRSRYANLDKLVFVSHDSMREFKSLVGEFKNMEVIYNPIDKNLILTLASEQIDEDFDSTKVNLVAVGNLLEIKGYERIIEVMARLRNENINVVLRILGEGYLEPKLKSLILSLGISDRVFLLGFKDNPYPYMKKSDIFVMSSYSEALPTALIESMILSLPAVVTNCSGCREISRNGEFCLMTENTTEDLYNGLKKMIQSEALRKHFEHKANQRSQIFDEGLIKDKIDSLFGEISN